MKLIYANILVVMVLEMFPLSLSAQEAIQLADLRLRVEIRPRAIKYLSEGLATKEAALQYKEACSVFANGLLYGRGPWGMGIFHSVDCKIASQSKWDPKSKLDWILSIDANEVTTELVLGRLRKSAEGQESIFRRYHRIEIPTSPKFMEAIEHPELGDFFAQAVLNAMPMSMVITNFTWPNGPGIDFDKLKFRGTALREDAEFLQPAPPERFKVFGLTYAQEKSEFNAHWVGDLNFAGFQSLALTKKTRKTTTAPPVWQADEAITATLKKQSFLWAKAVHRGSRAQQRLDSVFVRVYRYLTEGDRSLVEGLLIDDELEDSSELEVRVKRLNVENPGGFAGFRYGRSLVRDDPLLSNTQFYGLLLSLKEGPLDGFSLYVDISPETSTEDALGQANFVGWNRSVLGYAFHFKVRDFHFDLSPKLGFWSFNSRISAAAGDTVLPFEMSLNNALAVGMELGLEFRIPLLSARAWVGQDGAFSVLNELTGASVQSTRGGIDAFYTFGSMFSNDTREYGLAAIAFVFFDRITLENPTQGVVDAETDDFYIEASLNELAYSAAFFGLGLSLSW